MMVFSIVVFIVWAIGESGFDSKLKKVNHLLSGIIRVIGATVAAVITYEDFIGMTLFAWLLLVLFWIIFDPSYNLWKKQNVWYIGETSWFDKTARRVIGQDGRAYLAFKGLILISISCLLYG